MNESLNNLETIREYLLGRISDEKTLAGIEELLFTDDDFCTKAEIIEDDLINDFIYQKLNADDLASFTKTLENNSDRRLKVQVTNRLKEKFAANSIQEKTAFFESVKAFFRSPMYAGVFAVLLIAVLIGTIFLLRLPKTDELAELKNIYLKERPVEPRITGFDYAPLNITRGENKDDANKNKLELAKTKFLQEVVNNPSAESYHKLGVFYLTQQNYKDAIENLEKAVKADDKNATYHNDLGSAYFQSAKNQPDGKKLEIFAPALESFEKALTINPNFLEAQFNLALCLQEAALYYRSKDAWLKYLEKDSSSGWADEARKNLIRIEELNKPAKKQEQVLDDLINAYRTGNEEYAWQIISQTRELITEVWLPAQLTRRFLEANLENDDGKASESLAALKFIGELEKNKNADFFVVDLAGYYENANKKNYAELLKAKDLISEGYKVSLQSENEKAKKLFSEALQIQNRLNNAAEGKISSHWIAFSETNQRNLSQSNKMFLELESYAKKHNYKWLEAISQMRLSINYYLQNNPSKSLDYDLSSIKIMEAISDTAGQNVVYPDIAYSYFEMGEPQKSLNYLSESLAKNNSYYLTIKPKWTSLANISESLLWLRYRKAAVFFAEEHLQIAKQKLKTQDNIISAVKLLAKIEGSSNNQEKAAGLIYEALNLNEEITDEKTKQLNKAELDLINANIKRLNGNCQTAVYDYESAAKYYADFPEEKVRNYETQKGNLLCNEQLGDTDKLKKDIPFVIELLEKNRSEIVEEENRNLFFEKEQNVVDVAVNFELSENNLIKAFEYAETAKARSLLDFMQGNAQVSTEQTKFAAVTENLDLNKIRTRMPDNAQIVEYAVLPEKIAVWVITKEKFEFVETKINSDVLEGKVDEYVNTIINEKDSTEKISRQSNELFDLLIKPLLFLLDQSKQICFIPDKALFKLPFAALFSSKTNRFLIEDFALLYAPSSSIFVIASEVAKQRESIKNESLLIAGNPNFDKLANSKLANLPSAIEEVNEITRFYPRYKKFTGNNATKENILNELDENNVFHFAGHYVVNKESNSNSKLLMADSGEKSDLRIFEIAKKRLTKSKLVVLSACDTGVEKIYQGEGSIGIARIFLAIGSPSVISGLWQVNTESTKDLMISFHRNRKEKGLSIAESLRQAQIKMIKTENSKLSLPYFWSAFSQVGGIAK